MSEEQARLDILSFQDRIFPEILQGLNALMLASVRVTLGMVVLPFRVVI